MFTGVILNREWLDQNANRAYPLADTATETDVTGGFKLPRSLIVDMIFTVNVELNLKPAGFHITNVVVFAHGITITIGHTDTDTVNIATAHISGLTHVPGTSYYLRGTGDFDGMYGKITVGDLADTLKFGGAFTFDLAGGRLLDTIFRPDIRGVKSIQIVDGTNVSDKLFGNVILQPGRNMRISLQVNEDNSTAIRFDALATSDLSEECGCENDVALAPPIRTINGIQPKADGSFELVPKECVSITEGESDASLNIADSCSTPCCGTPELDIIRNDLENLNKDVQGIKHGIETLETAIRELSTIKRAIQNAGTLGTNDSIESPV